MDTDTIDISRTLVAKSDQLNADDLAGGPVTVKITGIKLSGNEDQPVIVEISGGHKPWKPCKTVRRLMSNVWGTNAAKWIGRWITLARDPKVLWGGKPVGGIRLTHMSGIKQAQTVVLNETSKTKAPHTVEPLTPPEPRQSANPYDDFAAALKSRLNLEPAAVCDWTRETSGRDLKACTADDLRATYDRLKPGGVDRAAFDASPFAG